MKVMLVEDDAGIRDALQMVLENAGIRVAAYEDGTAILEGAFDIPHIFIIDKQLTGVDGLDLCRHLKNKESTRNVPVIIMSATPDIAHHARQVCADDFIEKPFNNADLIGKIARLTKG